MAGTCLQCCVLVLAVFSVLIDAQCTKVNLLVDGQPYSGNTLYKLVGSSGSFVSCECITNRRVDWWDPEGMMVPTCGNISLTTEYCVDETPRRIRTLNFTSFMLSSAGAYTCRAKNILATLNISVLGPPTITNYSRNINVAMGSNAILFCEATDMGKLVYTWEEKSGRSWTTIMGATMSSYTTTISGEYRCIVSNEAGSVNRTITVNIYGPPSITTQPRDVTILQGTTTTLTCGATGSGKLMYSWERRSGSSWNTITNGPSYTTNKNMRVGKYMYRCNVSNEAGSVMSNSATVNVYGSPSITTQPRDDTIPQGTTTILTCRADGGGTLMYTWERRSGSDWNTVTNGSSYTANSNMAVGQYTYRCVVRNEAGSVVSSSATVNVYGPPSITTHPRDVTIPQGTTTTLTCSATTRGGTLMYSWERRSGSSWTSIKRNAKSPSYTTNSNMAVGQYTYRCNVSNDAGSVVSNSATVNVYGPPSITTHPRDITIPQGTTTTLTCSATTRGGTLMYSWETRSGSSWSTVTNSPSYTTNSNMAVGQYTYRCNVSNEAGSVVSNATVNVYGPPLTTIHPRDVTIPQGTTTTLTCNATGSGTLMYSWERKSGGSWTPIKRNAKSPSYTTNSNMAVGQYTYRCRVSNEAGSVVSNSATVNVYGPPTITTHPTSQLTTVSMSVTLNCKGTGRGSIKYQWQTTNINGGQWSNISNNRRLVVRNLQESQQYRCVVSNEAGGTRSNVANVTVLKITTHPSSTTVIALQDVTLTCSTSVDDVTYSWHRDDDSLPSRSRGQNSNTLTITRATPPDEGRYYCMASKEGISVESNRTRVRVDDQLSIRVAPTNPVIGERGTANLTATASGVNKRNFMYQWMKRDSSSLPNKVSGANGAVLTIPNLVESDEGKYYCTVTNQWDNSVSTDDVTLKVEAGLPLFWRYPQNHFVSDSVEVIFDCFSNGSNSTITITWEKDRKSYTSGVIQVITHSNGNSSSLTLNRARVADSGKYRCRATNTDGNSTTSNEGELLILPQILTNPDDDTVFIGQSTQLTCNASGTDIVYQWMKDGVVVSGANSNMLNMTNIEESDEGVYKCVASNKGGQVESNPATITVYGPPIVQELPQQVHVVLDEEFKITCTASNDQDAPTNLMFSWRRLREQVEFNETTTDEDDSHTASSTLHISSVTYNDSGRYRCSVRNGDGSAVTTFNLTVEVPSSPPRSLNIIHVNVSSLELTWNRPRHRRGEIEFYNVHFNGSDLPVQVVNVTNFTSNYTLDNLRPYTEYSVYVTAVRLIGTTGRSLEGEKSETVTARTLAGEPLLDKVDKSKPVWVINNNASTSDGTMKDSLFNIDLPVISLENGPFSHLYIIVVVNNSVIENVNNISTEHLLEKTNESSLLYYVAAVIYSYQYNSTYTMSYILGAGDNTTDPDGHVFYNREVQGNYYFFYRIFSANSTQENEIFTTTMIKPIHSPSSDDGSGGGGAVGIVVGVIVALLIIIAIIIAIILFLFYYKINHLKHNQNDLSQVVPSDSGIQMKEKEMKEEKAKALPVVNPVALSAQVPSDNLLMEVVTSAGQPTTLFVELPYADESEITWKKDNKPSNYPVLPDGSLYITNTNLSDSGVYTVTASSAESSMSERLRLKVINPQLPSEMSQHKHIKVDDFPEHVAMMRSKKNEQFEADYESMVVNVSFSQHTAKLHVNASKNRYKNIVPYDHSRVVLSLQGHKPGSDYVNATFIDGYKEPKAYIAAQGPVADTVDTFWRMIWEKNVATIVMVTRLVEDAKVKCHQYWPHNTEPATYGDYKVTILKQEEIAKYCIRYFTIEKVTNQKHEVRSVTQFHFTAWPDHGVPKYSTALLEFQKRIDKHHK
ncbi:receptor-type tyrosine-protein phosphatase S-like isoform X7 [Dysidea avara]|uniref:receptor-type tyrosine-protein phosphatase S-like isoform X7 n=1 Tax=Dysidea avara TaxID=196820 RepID=UPI00331ACF80